jgi:hypothetical protein
MKMYIEYWIFSSNVTAQSGALPFPSPILDNKKISTAVRVGASNVERSSPEGREVTALLPCLILYWV